MRRTGLQSLGSIIAIAPAALVIGAGASLAGAQTRASGGDVDLERLLRLPESYEVGGEHTPGASAVEWRKRFRETREAVEEARRSLAEAQSELESLAENTSQYQLAAPGVQQPENSPMSFRLRQELRRRRELLEQRQRELRSLEVEADLSEVPESWRDGPARRE